MTDKELLKMFGLYDRSVKLTLEEDINKTMNDFVRECQEYEEKKKEFIKMFKECYDDIVKIIELDGRIAVECFTCIRGMDLSKKYGKRSKEK